MPVKALSIQQIDEGRSKILLNARELVQEAELLLQHRRNARAYALAHLACEELSKIPMLVRAGANLLTGRDVDWKALDKRLRDHAGKIRMGLLGDYFFTDQERTDAEADATWAAVHQWSALNKLKNLSLYSALVEDHFLMPSDIITADRASGIVDIARRRLQFMEFAESLPGMKLSEQATSADFEERLRKHEVWEQSIRDEWMTRAEAPHRGHKTTGSEP